MSAFTAILPAGIALISTYAANLSYHAIRNVRTYEDQTKQAAKYSNIAEDALHETRTTEGAGAIAVRPQLRSYNHLPIPSLHHFPVPCQPLSHHY